MKLTIMLAIILGLGHLAGAGSEPIDVPDELILTDARSHIGDEVVEMGAPAKTRSKPPAKCKDSKTNCRTSKDCHKTGESCVMDGKGTGSGPWKGRCLCS